MSSNTRSNYTSDYTTTTTTHATQTVDGNKDLGADTSTLYGGINYDINSIGGAQYDLNTMQRDPVNSMHLDTHGNPSAADIAALLAANKITMDPPFVLNLDAAAMILSQAQHQNAITQQQHTQELDTQMQPQQQPHTQQQMNGSLGSIGATAQAQPNLSLHSQVHAQAVTQAQTQQSLQYLQQQQQQQRFVQHQQQQQQQQQQHQQQQQQQQTQQQQQQQQSDRKGNVSSTNATQLPKKTASMNINMNHHNVMATAQANMALSNAHAAGPGFPPQSFHQQMASIGPQAGHHQTLNAMYPQHMMMGNTAFTGMPGPPGHVMPRPPMQYGQMPLAPQPEGSPLGLGASFVDNKDLMCASPGDNGSRSSDKDANHETRRSAHILAEQKRRNNIKVGFEELQQIIPSCQVTPNSKFSKASILQKAIDYVGYLIRQKTGLLDELNKLRKEVQQLRSIIDEYNKLGGTNEIEERAKMFNEAVEGFNEIPDMYSKDNIKFFVFCHVVDKLFESFNAKVSLESSEVFSKTLLEWFEQYCAPDALRETFMISLQSMGTSLFTDESTEKFKRWGGALSACKDVMVTHLDNSRIPMAKTLGQTIDRTAGYLGATETLGTSPPIAIALPKEAETPAITGTSTTTTTTTSTNTTQPSSALNPAPTPIPIPRNTNMDMNVDVTTNRNPNQTSV